MMRKSLSWAVCWFVVFYAVYSISTRFIPTANLCAGLPADILYKFVIIGAGVLALFYVFTLLKTVKPNPSMWLLAAFILILGISTILNREYEFVGNLLGIATFTTQLIVFYLLSYLLSQNMIVTCMKLTGLFTSLFWTPGCAVSLYQYITNIHYTALNPENRRIRQGIIDGRLFGLFSDPNFAAFTSLLIIVLLIFAIRHTQSKLYRGYSICCIIINTAYIIMSNSRTIYIAAVGTLLFFVLLHTYIQNKEKTGQLVLTLIKKTAITLLAVVAVYAVIFFPMTGIGHLVAPDRYEYDMVRDDVTTDNITNNRSTIWKNYLELYKDKPVFGFSIRSALPYVSDKYPDSYLAVTQYVTHNGYLSLLIETGAVGFLVMGAFFVLTLIQSADRIRKCRENPALQKFGKSKPRSTDDGLSYKKKSKTIGSSYYLFATLTVAVLIFLMCFHDVFFTVNIETMLLFIGIGYIDKSNEADRNSDSASGVSAQLTDQ